MTIRVTEGTTERPPGNLSSGDIFKKTSGSSFVGKYYQLHKVGAGSLGLWSLVALDGTGHWGCPQDSALGAFAGSRGEFTKLQPGESVTLTQE